MTKYILHGGQTKIKNKFNNLFFKEIVSSKKGSLRVLLVFFAREEKDWKEHEERAKDQFTQADPQKHIEFEVAVKNPEKFTQQVKKADVIYLLGGTTPLIIDALSKVKNLEELFNGKIVVGSSAGAYVLSRYYYSNEADDLSGSDTAGIGKGLGILPIKVMAHYSPSLAEEKDRLERLGEQLRLITLEETKHFVIEK